MPTSVLGSKFPALIRPFSTSSRGFTLLELLVVVAIIAIGSAGVGFAMRDSAHAQLEREAQRLSALLESARAQSRAIGVPVHWVVLKQGFRFEGLPEGALPEHWLDSGVEVSSAAGSAKLTLGPEPLIGRQSLTLSNANVPGHQVTLSTDGLRPFSVQAGSP